LERFFQDEDAPDGRATRSDLQPRHTGWKALLQCGRRQRALVIDGGYGTAAVSLSSDFDEVVAAFDDRPLMRLVAARVSALGISNVRCADFNELVNCDLAAGFDAIIIYRVPYSAYLRNLVCCSRQWLRPDGSFYVDLFDTRGVTSQDRFFRSALGQVKSSLAEKCCSLQVFRHISGVLEIYELQPLTGFRRTAEAMLRTAAAPLRPVGFAILAHNQAGSSIAATVLQKLQQLRGRPLAIRRFLLASYVALNLIVADETTGEQFVIRIPLDEFTLGRFRRNYAALETVVQLPEYIRRTVPAPIMVSVDTPEFLVESVVQGAGVPQRLTARIYDVLVAQGAEWIAALHSATATETVLDEAVLRRLVLDPVERVAALLAGDPVASRIWTLGTALADRFRGRALNLVLAHGDYSIDNILLDAGGKISGVFDWDLSQNRGLPAIDLFYFLITAMRRRYGAPISKLYASRVLPMAFEGGERTAFDSYWNALHVPSELRASLGVLTWLYHLAYRLNVPEFYRFGFWNADMMDGVLEQAFAMVSPRSVSSR
jgi:aminoglycoside phosphotransferase (APT) family kinase protein